MGKPSESEIRSARLKRHDIETAERHLRRALRKGDSREVDAIRATLAEYRSPNYNPTAYGQSTDERHARDQQNAQNRHDAGIALEGHRSRTVGGAPAGGQSRGDSQAGAGSAPAAPEPSGYEKNRASEAITSSYNNSADGAFQRQRDAVAALRDKFTSANQAAEKQAKREAETDFSNEWRTGPYAAKDKDYTAEELAARNSRSQEREDVKTKAEQQRAWIDSLIAEKNKNGDQANLGILQRMKGWSNEELAKLQDEQNSREAARQKEEDRRAEEANARKEAEDRRAAEARSSLRGNDGSAFNTPAGQSANNVPASNEGAPNAAGNSTPPAAQETTSSAATNAAPADPTFGAGKMYSREEISQALNGAPALSKTTPTVDANKPNGATAVGSSSAGTPPPAQVGDPPPAVTPQNKAPQESKGVFDSLGIPKDWQPHTNQFGQNDSPSTSPQLADAGQAPASDEQPGPRPPLVAEPHPEVVKANDYHRKALDAISTTPSSLLA